MEETPKEIVTEAIDECEAHILRHKKYSWIQLALMLAVTVAFSLAFYWHKGSVQLMYLGNSTIDPDVYKSATKAAGYHPFVFLGSFVLAFGILVSLYRFHLLEITRAEQLKLGFLRIKIAALNTSAGFQTEVRRSLTADAFAFERKPASKKEIESPLPGHPLSDLGAIVLNKLLDRVEIVPKKENERHERHGADS